MKKSLLLAAVSTAFLGLTLTLSAADSNRKKSAFSKADTDHDGKVSQAEFVAAAKGKRNESKAADTFAKMDTNKDGFLTPDEFNKASSDTAKKDDSTSTDSEKTRKRRKPAN